MCRGYDMHINWFCKWMKNRKDIVFNELLKNEKKAQKDISIALNRLFDFNDIRKNIKSWNAYYAHIKNNKKIGYIFFSQQKIYDKCVKLIYSLK
jgi:hypothetical protein